MTRKEIVRKTIPIEPGLDERARDLVTAAVRHRINLDYGKALNLLTELGEKWLETSDPKERKKYRKIFQKYFDYRVFERSVVHDWVELEEMRRWKQKNRELEARSKQ